MEVFFEKLVDRFGWYAPAHVRHGLEACGAYPRWDADHLVATALLAPSEQCTAGVAEDDWARS